MNNWVSEPLAETTTDEKGEAEFDLNLTRFDRATYRVHVIAQGFEAEGGRSVTSEAATLVSSMPYLLGWKADGDLSYVAREGVRVRVIVFDDSVLSLIRIKQQQRAQTGLLTGDQLWG